MAEDQEFIVVSLPLLRKLISAAESSDHPAAPDIVGEMSASMEAATIWLDRALTKRRPDPSDSWD